jgi:hypothetical protein
MITAGTGSVSEIATAGAARVANMNGDTTGNIAIDS